MKDKYMIALHGCDDSTYIEAELDVREVNLLTRLSGRFKKASTYQCMPIMEIKPISECSEYELNYLKSEDDKNE